MVTRLSIVFGLLLLIVSGRATAEASEVSLQWVRLPNADSCIASRELTQRVETRLGRRVFVATSEADRIVEGRIERTRSGHRASIRMTGPSGAVLGERTIESAGEHCAAIDEPLVLIMALLIDPEALAPRRTTGPEPIAGIEAAPASTPEPPLPEPTFTTERELPQAPAQSPQSPAPGPPPWSVELNSLAGTSLGLLPRAPLRLTGVVLVTPPKAGTFELGTSIDVLSEVKDANFLAVVGDLAWCPPFNLSAGAFLFQVCAGVQAGAIFVWNTGSARTDYEKILADALVRLRVSFDLGKGILLVIRPTLAAPFFPRRFSRTLGPTTERLHTTFDVVGSLEIGFGLRFN